MELRPGSAGLGLVGMERTRPQTEPRRTHRGAGDVLARALLGERRGCRGQSGAGVVERRRRELQCPPVMGLRGGRKPW